MICKIGDNKLRKVRVLIAKDILDAVKQETPFDLKSYTQSMYSLFSDKTNGDHTKALDYTRTVPFFLNQVISSDLSLMKGMVKNGLNMTELTDLLMSIEDPTIGLEAIEDYMGLGQNTIDDLRELNENEPSSLDKGIAEKVEPVPVIAEAKTPVTRIESPTINVTDETITTKRKSDFTAAPSTMQADVSFESSTDQEHQVPDPTQQFYFKVKRNIVRMLGKSDVDYDSSKLNLPGYGAVYLTSMPSTSIPDEYLRDMDLTNPKIKEAHETGVVLALTTAEGSFVFFDGNSGEPVPYGTDNGKPAYYMLRNTTDMVAEDGNVTLDAYGKLIVISLANRLKTESKPTSKDMAAATEIVKRETKLINDIREYINEDKTRIIKNTITGGTMGYTKFDYVTINTKLGDVNFDGEVFDPKPPTNAQIEQGLYSGNYYFTVESMYERPIEIERARVKDSGLSNTLISLFVDDLVMEDSMGNTIAMDQATRRDLIEPYFMTSSETIKVVDGGVMLMGDTYPTATSEDKDKLKDILNRYFNKLAPRRPIAKSRLKGKTVIKKDDSIDYQSKYRMGSVLEVPQEKGASKYYIIEYAKHNILSKAMTGDTFDSVESLVPQDNGTVLVETKQKSYKQNYIKENFSIHYELNGEKKLVRMDSYFTFAPVQEDLDKMYKTDIGQEIIDEAIEDTVEPTTLLDEGSADDQIENLLKETWDDPELKKRLDIKGMDRKATVKQIAEARTWYENSPLSKQFPFETLFNAVNTEAVATWSMQGITLYKGADYSDLYHEAWHGFTQTFLTKEQKTNLYKETKKKSGSFTDFNGKRVSFATASPLQIEEYLAEDFRTYMLKGQKAKKASSKRNTIFRKIYNFLKALFENLSVSEVTADERANDVINTLYEKLRVGNLNEFSFAQKNVMFGELNTGIQPTEGSKEEPLLYEDSMLIVETIDSLISEFIDRSNSGLTKQDQIALGQLETQLQQGTLDPNKRKTFEAELDGLKKKQTYNFTSKLLKTPNGRMKAYTYARIRLGQIHNDMRTKMDSETNEATKSRMAEKVELLSYAVKHFGDTKNMVNNKPDSETGDIKRVIAYHAMKSNILEKEDVDVIFKETKPEESEQYIAGREGYNRLGNETSMKELAGTEILTILHTLAKYDKDKKIEVNKLGVAKLTPFREVWNRLARMLAGKSAEEMEQLLKEQAEDYLPIKQLLGKLGPLATASMREDKLWTSFWRTFNLTKVPLTQMTTDQIIKDGKTKYESRIGDATGEFRKIGRQWETDFKRDHSNPYTKTNNEGALYLDLEKVLKDFPADKLSNRQWEFFNAIGFSLSDKKEIRKALATQDIGGAKYYRDKLESLKDRGNVEIKSLDDINQEYKYAKIGTKPYKALEDQNWRFKQLQELEIRYSDQFSNFMVSTATGNSQSEYTLNSTLTQYINKLNDARDIVLEDGTRVNAYQVLISKPETSHFDIKRNVILRGSTLMNSLFKMDVNPYSAEYGQRRKTTDKADAPFVQLELSNLSGVLLQHNGISTGTGIESAKADPYTKLIMDLHLMIQSSTPELLRHGDKSTSYSATLNKVFTNGEMSDAYVPTIDFFRGNIAHDKAMKILIPHIAAELERVNIMKVAALGIENYDHGYVERGKKFVAFDAMLSADTKKLLYALPIELSSYLEEGTTESKKLAQRISKDVFNYFSTKSNSLSEKFAQADFVADSLLDKIMGSAANLPGVAPTVEGTKDILIKSLTYNTWINNIESMAVLYGDIAQYNIGKDELHKRNSGIGSTGLLARTDKSKIDFVNRVLGRGYAELIGAPIKTYDGTFSTAIIRDHESQSAYLTEYTDVLGKNIGDYGNMNEADAMGYISFDSYRILKDSQGQWMPAHEAMYQNLVAGKRVDPKEIKDMFFPTIKAQYFGVLNTEGLPLTAFHKFELYPLIPDVIQDSPKLVDLHNKMTFEGIDYIVFESGSKLSKVTKDGQADNFYNDAREVSTEPFTKNDIFIDYLKDQLEIAPKFKGKVTFPTQLRTLIEEGSMENGVPTDFAKSLSVEKRMEEWDKQKTESAKEKASPKYKLIKDFERNINALTEIKKKKLLKRANWELKEDGTVSGNMEDLVKFLKGEMQRLDMGDHEINFLEVKDGKLKHDASMALFADKLERVLQALVTKELINQDVTGEALVQVSGAMFESEASTQDRNYTNPTEEDLAKWGTNDLPTYHKGSDGKTKAMKVKIALQGEFKKLLRLKHTDGELVRTRSRLNEMIKDEAWLNEGENRRMITMVGVRIPVQGMNSMEFMEVYEFLPAKAGNIVVPPAEIVAKSGSDFDIDKLTVTMPSFQSIEGDIILKKTYEKSSKEAKALYEKYKAGIIAREKMKDSDGNKIDISTLRDYRMNDEIDEEEKIRMIMAPYTKLIGDIFGISLEDMDQELEEALLEDGDMKTYPEFLEDLNGSKAVENDLLWSIKAILEHGDNYANLIRPNDTDLVKPLAMRMAPHVSSFDPKGTITGSEVLGYEFNLNKHNSNNSGKKTLSIGAVGNKWNPLFNRIGFYLSPSKGITPEQFEKLSAKKKLSKEEKTQLRDYRRQKLYLPHRNIKTKEGQAISLSGTMDVKNENRISDVINQMMNGWLDIAKDDWIFYLQGNEEITPSLEFMLEAGVPIEDAVMLVSTPLVREYVKQQQLYSSTFAEALDKTAPTNLTRNAAKVAVLTNPKFKFELLMNMDTGALTQRNVSWHAYNAAVKNVGKTLEGDKAFDSQKLFNVVKNKKDNYGPYQLAAFLHFLEIEQMAAAMRDIKLRMNPDTTRSATMYEAQNRLALEEELAKDQRFPSKFVKQLKDNSPISSFFIQDFQLDIWKDIFPVRNHEAVQDFLRYNVSSKEVGQTFGKKELLANEFQNDLISFIFQNSIGSFNINTIKSYRGMPVEKVAKGPAVEIKNDKIYMNSQELFDAYVRQEDYAGMEEFPFGSAKEYYKYAVEEEYLRYTTSLEKVKDTPGYQRTYDLEIGGIDRKENESSEVFKERSEEEIYQIYLQDKALDNVNNMSKLFKGKDTYADQFMDIRKSYPELSEDFAIIEQLSTSTGSGYVNLKLNDTSLDGDMINLYHENLGRLANPQVKKVEDPIANKYISDFFNRFSTAALLQSGLNTKSAFSMVRVVPQDKMTRLMEEPMKHYTKHFDKAKDKGTTPPILQDFYNKFLENNANRSARIRGKNYSSEISLAKSIDMLNKGQQVPANVAMVPQTVSKTVPVSNVEVASETQAVAIKEVTYKPVTDQQVKDYMNYCKKG